MINYPTTLPQPERSPSHYHNLAIWGMCRPWIEAWSDANQAVPTCASGNAWCDRRVLPHERMYHWRGETQRKRLKAGLPLFPEIDIDPNYPAIGIDSPESSPAPSSASPPSPPTSPLPDGLALPARTQGESVAQGPAASSHSMVTRSARQKAGSVSSTKPSAHQKAAPLPSTKSKISKRQIYALIAGAKQKKSTGSRGAKATTKPATGSSVPQVSNAQLHPANAAPSASVPQASTSNAPQPASLGSFNYTGPFRSSLYNFDFPEFNFDFLKNAVPGPEVVNPNALDVASGAAAGGSTHAEPGPNPPIGDGSNV